MNFADWNQYLTPAGTFGWFMMLVAMAVRHRRPGELFVGLLFSMAIIDGWAVAPAEAAKHGDRAMVSLGLWSGALLPYLIVVWWLFHPLKRKQESASDS